MAGVYRPRHPERTVLYRVLFHYFERFLAEYESRFENESLERLSLDEREGKVCCRPLSQLSRPRSASPIKKS